MNHFHKKSSTNTGSKSLTRVKRLGLPKIMLFRKRNGLSPKENWYNDGKIN
jgi:hypothetical protein